MSKPAALEDDGGPAKGRRLCTIRTRFASAADLRAALPLAFNEDGTLFVPAADLELRPGERITFLLTLHDGTPAAEERGMVLRSRTGAGGIAGFVVRLDRAAELAKRERPAADAGDDDGNPFVGVDSQMLSLFVEFSLTEHDPLTTSYDEIPMLEREGEDLSAEIAAGAADDPTPVPRTTEVPPAGRFTWSRRRTFELLGGALFIGLGASAAWAWRRRREPEGPRAAIAPTPPQPPPAAAAPPTPARREAPTSATPARPEAPTPASPTSCRVQVRSIPDGAEIWVGGEKRGISPAAIDVPCGTAEMELRRPRYAASAVQVQSTPQSEARVEARLVRPTAQVTISSAPTGAEVRVRGRVRGRTPITLELPRFETQDLEVAASGFRPAARRLYLKQPVQALSLTLEPAP